jgi:hypothetical protein
MNFLGGDFLRRGRSSPPDVEHNGAGDDNRPQPEMQERVRSTPRRFPISRPTLPTLFSSRMNAPRQQVVDQAETDVESPKTPRFTLGLPTLPSTRLHLPHLTRTWTSGSNGPASRPNTARPPTARAAAEPQPRPSFQRALDERFPSVVQPDATAQVEPDPARTRLRRFDGADPAELHLAELADDGRRRRRNIHHRRQRGTPKRFLFCFPWIRSRRIRSQILRCFVSGMFLILLLTVCKSI